MSKTIGRTAGISFFVIIIAFIAIVALMGEGLKFWTSNDAPAQSDQNKNLNVVTTLFPYYDMARALAEDGAVVQALLPPGVNPHHYEPKPSDVKRLNEADIFVYTGPLLEPWAEDLLKNAQNPDLVVVNASEHAANLFMEGGERSGLDSKADHEISDPHIWLDMDNDISILNAIRDAFMKADSSMSDAYRDRALIYESALASLDSRYRETFDLCRTRTFVHGGHRSFGYVAQRYHLDYYATTGVEDTEEPTANELAGLIALVNEKALPYVFYGSFDSPRVAEVIAKESGAGMLSLNSAANITKGDFDNGVTFFDIMESNLRNLSLALECQ